MFFRHSNEIWSEFPELVPGVLSAEGITSTADVEGRIAKYHAIATERLARRPESEMAEIQAWRRGFSKMGLKPTQYRCASEALLRDFARRGRCRGCIRSSISAMPSRSPSRFPLPFSIFRKSPAISKCGMQAAANPI